MDGKPIDSFRIAGAGAKERNANVRFYRPSATDLWSSEI